MRSGVPSAFGDDALKPIFAVHMAFDSGDVRFWSGIGEATIDGDTYLGAGNVLQISNVEETGEIAARGITITGAGLNSSIISTALSENYQNRAITVYIGSITEAGVTDTYVLFRGRMDTMTIEESGETCNVAIAAENRLVDLERPRIRRYTNEDQKSLYSGDLALEFVDDLQDKAIEWGRS